MGRRLGMGIAILIGFICATTPLAAQGSAPSGEDTAKAAADPAPAAGRLETVLAGFKLSGFAEASYSYSTETVGNAIVGRLYDRFSDQFTLNALKLVLDRPFATDKLDAGLHVDVLVGQNAPVLQSNGFGLGTNGDVTQLYVTLNVPTPNRNGLQFKAGKFVTLMGLEVIEDVANPNWSEGNQFIYVENFTSTGVEAGYKFSGFADAQVRIINGWDVVADNNTRKSFMGRVGIYPDAKTAIGLLGFLGPEEANNDDAQRYGADVLFNRKLGAVSV